MTQSPTPVAALVENQEKTGMNLEDVRALLANMHNTSIPENDPLLMIVTILNAYLGEVQKLHARHEQGLSRLMAEKTDTYVSGVKVAVEQLSASLSSASVEGVRKVFEAHAATLNSFRYAVYWAAAIVSASALVNVAVFVLRGLR
ncbi:MAG: hypothetical protein LBU06_09020 [Desulfovibrio sp.]|jgi:hypothetical protein|nr:hypothetical protein [Desulfovibrio sp.]